jgi:hypothetical protein
MPHRFLHLFKVNSKSYDVRGVPNMRVEPDVRAIMSSETIKRYLDALHYAQDLDVPDTQYLTISSSGINPDDF